jgi:glucose-1-phosphate cytidylyltransferase
MNLPVILLAGGLGTRLREETEFKPKPMVEIGGKPVLWHLMTNLAFQDLDNFIVCGGYKVEVIKEYFQEKPFKPLKERKSIPSAEHHNLANLRIIDTGELTPTGGRIHHVKNLLQKGSFLVTYGDGLANVDISKLLQFHKSHGKLATVTVHQPLSRFGLMDLNKNGQVKNFREKPQIKDWVNIGFFIFEYEVFNFLDTDTILEQEPLRKLAELGELFAYKHVGFWEPMDTYREYLHLASLWENKQAHWKNW